MANALNKVKTSGVEDDAISLAKMAPGTDGQIITYDASGNPTAVGPGTDGQVLTSTGAGSPPAFESISIPAGTTINNNADNKIITGSDTANTLEGEANLTFDGTDLSVTGKILVGTTALGANADDLCLSTAANTGLSIKSGTTSAGNIYFADGTSGTDLYRGYVSYDHNTDRLVAGTANTTALTIDSNGNIEANIGNIVIGTSGKGIDFSATTHNAGASSEVLDDYETGTWTIGGDDPNFNGFGSVSCYYTKVGRVINVTGKMVCLTNSSSTNFYFKNLPYAAATNALIPVSVGVSQADDGLFFNVGPGLTTGYLRNASQGLLNYGQCSNQWMYFTGSYVTNA